jgi:hypothetical protein
MESRVLGDVRSRRWPWRRQTIEFDSALHKMHILPFGSEGGGSYTQLSAQGDWLVATDPAAHNLVAYNAKTRAVRTVAVSSIGNILPVLSYGLAWNRHEIVFAHGLPGEVDYLSAASMPF